MEVTYGDRSSRGPVREQNEDYTACSIAATPEDRRGRGSVAVLADGVGGQKKGEVASRMACESAVAAFAKAPPATSPGQLLYQMFNAANHAVYDHGQRDRSKMATTLSITLFRNNEITVGHVGDCRVYLIQNGRIRRVTNDHSYAGVQLKLGLITVEEAKASPLRFVLTRSVGQDAMIRVDYHTHAVNRGDVVVQCSDGFYCFVTEGEILDKATALPPDEACRVLVELAERRGTDDNLSVQIVHVRDVERLSYYRGLPTYQKVPDLSMREEFQNGQVLDDRFLITDPISRSGMASLYKATDLATQQTVALKLPFMHYESDPQFYSRFIREGEIGARLRHPYVLRFIPPPERQSRPYLVMEYLEGQTLGHLMRSVSPMPVGDALKVAARICEALHYLHGNDVVHRDLKPDNVMICNDGTIRVMDFGIAKARGQRRLTFGGFQPAMGTPDYMAPEQVRGRRGDPRTDVYSLGAILYEMLTGRPPFEGANPLLIMNARLTGDPAAPRTRNPEIPPRVEEIILHAMERNPADRYAGAMEMKQELDRPEAVELTGRADRLKPPVPWRSRWRRNKVLILAVVLPLAAWGLWFLISHLHWQ